MEVLTKARTKFVKSLKQKKHRKEHGLFVVEGAKTTQEVLASDYEVQTLYATSTFLEANDFINNSVEVVMASRSQLTDMSTFQSNDSCLAVVKIKENKAFSVNDDEYALITDDVRDPGNFGTILRICDWFGIKKVVASHTTVEMYNPKVIAASMGSFLRTRIYYTDLHAYLATSKLPKIGASMHGKDVHTFSFPTGGLIVMGNESNGITLELQNQLTHEVTIPLYGQAESLNVSVATAVILDNLARSGQL